MKKWTDTIRVRVQDFRRDVIRMMRLKFILMAMGILIAVFLIMLGSINMIMKTVSESQSMRLLEQIAESERYNTLTDDMQHSPEPPPDIPADQPDYQGLAFSGNTENGGIYALSWGRPDTWEGDDRFQYAATEPNEDGWDNNQDFGDWPPPPDNWSSWDNDQNPGCWPPPPDDWGGGQRPDDQPPPWDNTPPTEYIPPTETEPIPEPAPEPVPEPEPTEPAPSDEPEDVPTEASPTEMETEETVPTETETVPATEPAAIPTEPSAALPTDPRPVPREPKPNRWNISITIDHFAVMADAQGHYLGIRNTEDYTDEAAQEILSGILESGKDKGMYGWLQFCRTEKSYGTLLVITDKTSDQGLLNHLFRLTVIVGTLMLLALLVVVILLSRWITEPVQTAFRRQKQFVSDAGHELKTPIAVLTANADILQDELGSNKWLAYMQEQISRMNQLVGDLLHLARMDNAAQEYHFADFDLSLAVAATTLPFESAAFEQHRNLEMDVQPGVQYHGSEQHIRQLCAIFLDNALKYSDENGIIKVTLLQRGEQRILEFYNTGCEISPSETEKIFERFYRGDTARNNTGKNGYGLGLAIAKSIMDIHKIKIQVTCEQGKWIRFLLTM